MSGITYVISSITAGLQTQWGSATVENAAQGATFQGFLSARLGQTRVRDGQHTTLSFAFTDLPAFAGRFDFTPSQRPFLLDSLDALSFGQPTVENAAQAAYPSSVSPVAIGQAVVSDQPPWVFDLVALPENTLALQFNFGGAQLVVPQGLASLEIGLYDIKAPLWARFDEGLDFSRFGQAVLSDRPPWVFDLTLPPENVLALQFNFGGSQLIVPSGLDSFESDVAFVENAAGAMYFAGIPPVRFGMARVSASEPLLFDFSEITQPNAANIPFAFGTNRAARFTGWDSSAIGALLVLGELGQYTRVAGFFLTRLGHPSLSLEGADIVYPLGFDSFESGEFEVGIVPSQDVVFAEVSASTAWGDGEVSNFYRTLPPIPGFHTTQLGTPWLSHTPRTIEFPPLAEFLSYFGHFQVGYHRDVAMASPFELTQWGEADVDLRRFIPEGLESLQFPEFFRVTRSPRAIQPFSWDARALGEPVVWNLSQFIELLAPDTNPDTYTGSVFGRVHWFKVFNVTRVVQLNGLDSLRFALSPLDALSAGRAVTVEGFDSLTYPPFSEWQRHLVAYAVRAMGMPGFDSLRVVSYHSLHNDAWLAAFSGTESSAYGQAFVWRWLQRAYAQGRKHDEAGLSWVAFGLRGFEMRTPRQMLEMPHVTVGHTPLYVEPEGLLSFGFTDLFSFAYPIPSIRPMWDVQYWDERNFTPPRVWNVTPEIRVSGRNMASVGDRPFVWFRVRDVAAAGLYSFRADRLVIAHRDRVLPLPGFQSSQVSQNFYIIRSGVGLPFDQTIQMSGDGPNHRDDSHFESGRPVVTGNILHFRSDLAFSKFGQWSIFGHSVIFTAHGYPAHGFFESGLFQVSGGVRTVTVGAYRDNNDLPPPKFRVTPHTIWMRTDAPAQAKENHPGRSFCLVDQFCGNTTPSGYSGPSTWPWWGDATVRLQLGVDNNIRMKSATYGGTPYIAVHVGRPSVENSIRSIYPEPWLSFWQGYPRVTTPTDQFMRMWSGSQTSTVEFSEFRVDPYPPPHRSLAVAGLPPSGFGQHEVENQHRSVYMSGLNATDWGNNNPMVYHYPRGFTPINSDLTQWGVAWLSHSPRSYVLGGHDFFSARWVDFSSRMRVELDKRYIYGYNGFESMRIPHFHVSGMSDRTIEVYGFVWPNTCSEFEVSHV